MESFRHVHGNGIDLTHVADAERGEDAEAAEQNSQYGANLLVAGIAAQAILEVVHGAAAPLTILILAAIVDAQHIFGIVGHHAEDGDNPHPEHGAGATGGNGGCHTGNIARADGGGQGGAQALELADGAVFLGRVGGNVLIGKDSADGLFHPVPKPGQLEGAGQDGHQDAGTHQHYQHGHSPNESIDGIVDSCDSLNDVFHFSSPLVFSKNMKKSTHKGYSPKKGTVRPCHISALQKQT